MSERFEYVLESAMAAIRAMAKEYGAGDEIPDRIRLKAQSILGAVDGAAAEALRKRAVDAAQVHYLSQWSKGKIPGKETPHSLELRAKDADGLAAMLESKGQPAEAEAQRARAREIRSRIKGKEGS